MVRVRYFGQKGISVARNSVLTDEQVELEIERLNKSPLVALARKKHRIDYRRRQYLYQLRDLEKRGKALADAGFTLENLEDGLSECCLYEE